MHFSNQADLTIPAVPPLTNWVAKKGSPSILQITKSWSNAWKNSLSI